jgi:RNA-directed DNA polymerase
MQFTLLLDKRDLHAAEIRRMICTSNCAIPSFSKSVLEGRALAFLSISNWLELSLFLKLSPLKLEQLINSPEYKEFTIPKKKGKPRLIFQPDNELMKMQRKLNLYIQSVYSFQLPENVHGFIPKSFQVHRSIVSNAKPHLKKQRVLSIDLENYFSSIHSKKVRSLFLSWGFTNEIATALTLLCTYKGALPTGAPTSPVLANLCSLALDEKLLFNAQNHGLTYTRYADDLTFSGDEYISEKTMLGIIDTIQSEDFKINLKKLRCIGTNKKQKITGIVVNHKLTVDRNLKKKLRAMLYDIGSNGLSIATQKHHGLQSTPSELEQNKFLKHVMGIQSFVKMVEKQRFGGDN